MLTASARDSSGRAASTMLRTLSPELLMEATSGQSSARTGMVGGGGARSGAGAYQTKHFSAVDSERHPIFLEFADSSLEQLYRVYAARRGIAYLRRTCLILLALLLAMTVMELTWAGSPWSADQVAVLSCRGLAVLWISTISTISSQNPLVPNLSITREYFC